MIRLRISTWPPLQAESPPEPAAERDDNAFKLIAHRRQRAAEWMVVVFLLTVFSGASYLIGRSIVQPAQAPPPIIIPNWAAPPPIIVEKIVAEQPSVEQPSDPPEPAEPPLFDAPIPGRLYMQGQGMSKGSAAVWAQGLRAFGLAGFVAPGPKIKTFRVVIGPLPDPGAYSHAKQVLNRLGLTSFERRY